MKVSKLEAHYETVTCYTAFTLALTATSIRPEIHFPNLLRISREVQS